MKTPEELNALKTEFEALSAKLRELTEEDLQQVAGGWNSEEYEVFLSLCNGKQDDKAGAFPVLPAFP